MAAHAPDITGTSRETRSRRRAEASSGPVAAYHPVLALQRSAGNQAVLAALSGSAAPRLIQRLRLGALGYKAGDYEYQQFKGVKSSGEYYFLIHSKAFTGWHLTIPVRKGLSTATAQLNHMFGEYHVTNETNDDHYYYNSSGGGLEPKTFVAKPDWDTACKVVKELLGVTAVPYKPKEDDPLVSLRRKLVTSNIPLLQILNTFLKRLSGMRGEDEKKTFATLKDSSTRAEVIAAAGELTKQDGWDQFVALFA